jgi:hypothetical protein
MSDPFIFRDSLTAQPREMEGLRGRERELPGLFVAIEKLNKAAGEGKLQLLSVSGKRRAYVEERPEIVTYAVNERSSSGHVSSASFNVSHYIGSYSTRVGAGSGSIVTIVIKPRWGDSILHYLLQYTTGIYLPPDGIPGLQDKADSTEWILLLLWRSVFNQALRRSHIPKEYRKKLTNDRVFKGRLDVLRQIRENIADQSKFCCTHSPLTVDTTINQTIRCVFRLTQNHRAGGRILNDIAGYDERLGAFGVKSRDVRPDEIDRIRYTRMSEGYRPLMQVGKAIIRRFGASRSDSVLGESSFFIDVAEIWENYLEAILTRHLPPTYRVINPNNTGGQWLFVGQRREIRPDLIIENEAGIPVAVLDAKFKSYTTVGKYARDGVSREDLFQMATYLYHYGEDRNTPLLGLFISPEQRADDPYVLESRRNHSIGVLNFDLAQWDDGSFNFTTIRAYEKKFTKQLQELVELGH